MSALDTIEGGFTNYILSQSAITSIIGTRLYFLRLAKNVDGSALVYRKNSHVFEHAHSGRVGLSIARFDLTMWTDEFETMISLERACVLALDAFSGLWGNVPVNYCKILDIFDEEDTYVRERERTIDLEVMFNEA
jgi:hypothetical protein